MLPVPMISTPFVAQRTQLAADLPVRGRIFRHVHAELYDGHVGFGIGVHQHRPGSVVEPPAVIARNRHRRKQLAHARASCRIAGRWILHIEQRLREMRRSREWWKVRGMAVTAVPRVSQ